MAASLGVAQFGSAERPTLVLSPSLGTTGAMWDPQLTSLAERFRVLVIDHRGHGASEVIAGPATIADLGIDIVAALDDAGVDRCSWAGLSLGGMVGIWIASRHPERIERLALLCTAAHLPPASVWHDRAALVRAQGTAAVADAVVARWFTPELIDGDPDTVRAHRDMLVATPDEGYAACCEAIATMDLRSDLLAVTAPTLVIAGANDPATPPSFAEAITAGIRDARVEVLDHAAHLANVEQPEHVTKLLVEHLDAGPEP